MKQQYAEVTFKRATLALIDKVNAIVTDYMQQGYVLTVRQIYYQLVIRNEIANDKKNYKLLTRTINDGRIAGLIDWDAIEDRTRAFECRPVWHDPKDFMVSAADQYFTDPWDTQDIRVVIVVEKEALEGIFSRVCHQYAVPLLCARGYPSASVMRDFATRNLVDAEQETVFLHFGDHDPSGIDMTRDLEERFSLFSFNAEYTLKRMALNYDQVKTYKPPPNPAKSTDTRFAAYRREHGSSSWELDALSPSVLSKMASDEIEALTDQKAWAKWRKNLDAARARMQAHAQLFKG